MTQPRGELSACDYCGLPLPRSLWGSVQETTAAEAPRYCCVGCRIAAAVTQETGEAGAVRWTLVKLGFAGFFTMNVLMFTMMLWSSDVYGPTEQTRFSDTVTGLFRYLAMAFACPVLFLLGQPLLENAVDALKRRTLSTDLLLLTGVLASFGYSAISVFRGTGSVYFEVGCVILVLVMVGRWLETTGRIRAGQSLDALERLLPDQVRVVYNGNEVLVPREQLKRGDHIRVLAGERFASDGRIIEGNTSVDQQLVTGETWPEHKPTGTEVSGGTLNLEGVVVVELTVPPTDGTVQRLIRAVHEARAKKGSYERLAERISVWFFPIVAVAAIGAFAWHTAVGGIDQGILCALAVVLIACPCSLALATPLAVWTALTRAGAEQIVLKGGDALERLAKIKVICFDKTGTLTTGHPRVIDFVAAEPDKEWQILSNAAAIARSSGHVFSSAIVEFAHGCPLPSVTDARNVPGRGMIARLQGSEGWAYLGNLHFVEEAHLSMNEMLRRSYHEAAEEGKAASFVGWDGKVQGLFVFAETLRPGAKALLEACETAGLDCVVLTGDHWQRACLLSDALGVSVSAELTPEDKVRRIQAIHARIGPVAMVGDGINDAPALAAADIGIAMGCGADVSRDSADICLMGNELSRLSWLYGLAKATVRTIRLNLFWAFAYNAIGIVLALTGRLNPIVAALCMVASSASVVANSLRLRNFAMPVTRSQSVPDETQGPSVGPSSGRDRQGLSDSSASNIRADQQALVERPLIPVDHVQ
jgi:heavy metal translocating P-type ATPase